MSPSSAPGQSHTLTVLRPVTLHLTPILCLMLFIAIFAGCQGGRYYLANRLQELGIACALGLYLVGAWRSVFLLPSQEWRRWVIHPVLLILGIMLTSSLVFRLNYHGNVFYSFFSAREFLLAFLGPGTYLLVRTGLAFATVKRVIWLALFALMINYLFFYFTMDLQAAFFSADHTVSNLVTFDEWRGFRLKPPLFAIMVALLAALVLLVQARSAGALLIALSIVAIAIYIWSIVQFRSTLATMLLSMLLYPLFLSQTSRLKFILVLTPIGLLLLPPLVMLALDHFLQADGGNVRAMAFAKAFTHIPQHPLLGAGEDSAYGDSYQDLVAPYFFPSDLGLVGVAYKYGLVGTGLYLFMHARIWLSLWRANIAARQQQGRLEPLLWGLLIFMSAQTFNLALNPGLAYAQGITLGSLGLAVAALQRRPHAA